MHCPLCTHQDYSLFCSDKKREYYLCHQCRLVFVPDQYIVSPEAEKQRYDTHRNDPNDERYRNFLKKAWHPVINNIHKGAHGLDFGSGPGPTLSLMLEEAGYKMDIYDPFYANYEAVFMKTYDFITITEVAEHLNDTGFELNRLYNMLNPGGMLVIMTGWCGTAEAFKTWKYKTDKTHIRFFSPPVFKWLAGYWNSELQFHERTVVSFRR